MYSRWSRPLLVVPLLVFAACDQDPVRPSAAPQLSTTTTTTASGLPARISNSTKYKDAGKKAATGREGSASLMVRALLSKAGEVELDVTTGTEDDLNAKRGPGNLDKVQVKEFDPAGNLINVSNYNKLKNGGFAQYGLKHMVRGGGVQVQANVSGIDPNRSDIVTVTDLVKLRPDLAARNLSAPGKARVQTAVNISATVLEINGDVGARANCVLSVDGTEVDRASGIWVDANSAVSCAFTHTFTSTGTKALAVAVTDVMPGDYDTGNNRVSGSIEITNTNDFYNYGYAYDVDYANKGRHLWKYTSSTYNSQGEWTWDDKGWVQSAYMTSYRPKAVAFPAKVQIRHVNNGTEVVNKTVEWAEPSFTYRYYYSVDDDVTHSCGVTAEQSSAQTIWIYLCSISGVYYGQPMEYHVVGQGRYAGEVTYMSKGYNKVWYRVEGDGYSYTWNYSYTNLDGRTRLAMAAGTDYTLSTVLTVGTEVANAELTIPLGTFDYSHTQPYTAYSYSGSDYTWSGNYEYTFAYKGVHGYAHNEPTQ